MITTKKIAIALCWSVTAAGAQAQAAASAFPGNEAVQITNGKRVVEAPPMTATAKQYVQRGGKHPPPAPGAEVFMIEGPDALMECSMPYMSTSACMPSTLGTTKRLRFWTVKIAGKWMHCNSRSAARQCEAASAGVPGGMSTME